MLSSEIVPAVSENKLELGPDEVHVCRTALYELCDTILASRPENSWFSFYQVGSSADPATTRKVLDELTGDLLLKTDDNMMPFTDTDTMPIGSESVKLKSVDLRADHESFPRERFIDGKRILMKGEVDETRWIDLRFNYFEQEKQRYAIEQVSLYANNFRDNALAIGRSVIASEYLETGYEGHDFVGRTPRNADEFMGFLAIAADIWQKRRDDY